MGSRKESFNVEKHRLDFTTAGEIWVGPVIEKIDDRGDCEEIRIIAIGLAGRHLLVVVCTWRGDSRRMIPARRANSREKALYEEEIAQRS